LGNLNLNVSIYCQNDDGAGNEWADVYVDYTGAGSGTYVGTIGQHTNWQYDTIDLGTHAANEVNKLRIYLIGERVGQPGDVRLDHIRIGVEKTTYELDLEVQWTSADFDEANEYLCIYGGSMGAEDIGVDIWYGSTWNNVFTDLSAGWRNFSVASYLDDSTFTIRFKGGSETTDTTQDTWQIDSTLLHTWTNIYERDTGESLEGLEASATTFLTMGRLPQQRMDVEAQASREGSFWRYASEEVIISTVAQAFKSVTKAVEQTLNLLAQVTRTRSMSRLASESIIIQTLADSVETFRRTGSEAVGVLTQVVREWSLSRNIAQPVDILAIPTRQMTAIRATAQPIQILTQAFRQKTVIRLPSLALSIQAMAQAPSTIFRTIQQLLVISADASRQWSLYKSLSQPLRLFTSVSRQYTATRQASQLVQLLTQTSGQWTAVRAPNQVLSIQALAQTAETFKKTAQQTLGILVEASRQLTCSRAPAQPLQLFAGVSRQWASTRAPAQSLTLQALAQSTGTFVKSVQESMLVLVDAPRELTVSRALSETIQLFTDIARQYTVTVKPVLTINLHTITQITSSFIKSVKHSLGVYAKTIRMRTVIRLPKQVLQLVLNVEQLLIPYIPPRAHAPIIPPSTYIMNIAESISLNASTKSIQSLFRTVAEGIKINSQIFARARAITRRFESSISTVINMQGNPLVVHEPVVQPTGKSNYWWICIFGFLIGLAVLVII
jgi:hypothetical protein